MGCITLLSDFGLQDASVASAKGIIMQYVAESPIVDLSHLVEPFHLQQAAYLLLASYKDFPKGTFHVCLFDIFYDKQPKMALCEKDGHYFLAPDNGLMSVCFGNGLTNVWKCFELDATGLFRDWLHATGKILRQLQTDGTNGLHLPKYELINAPLHCRPKIDANSVECQVIHIDRYENVVINITKQQFNDVGMGRNFTIKFMRDEELREITTHYYNVKEGEKMCRFNATGYLEIAINRDKAASLFGLRLHKDRHVIYNTIKIFFE